MNVPNGTGGSAAGGPHKLYGENLKTVIERFQAIDGFLLFNPESTTEDQNLIREGLRDITTYEHIRRSNVVPLRELIVKYRRASARAASTSDLSAATTI